MQKPVTVTLVYALSGAVLMESLARELRLRGYDLRLWSELSEDAYRSRNGMLAYLVRLRMWLVFPFRVAICCLLDRKVGSNVYLVANTPFYLPLVARFFARRSAPVIHVLWDLYPDQLILAGKLRDHALVTRLCGLITKRTITSCDATVFIGKRLRAWAETRYGRCRNGWIVEVGADGDIWASFPSACAGVSRILYAGNLGYAHDVETLACVLRCPLPEGVEVSFHASGSGYIALKKLVDEAADGRSRANFSGPLPTLQWARVMRETQVALVTMRYGAENILFPSKAYSAMLAGQALFAICPKDSDLAGMIIESDCGWVVEPGDIIGCRGVFEIIANNPMEVLRKRQNAWCFGRAHFNMPVIADHWSNIIKQLLSS